jgi:hypothetical protein
VTREEPIGEISGPPFLKVSLRHPTEEDPVVSHPIELRSWTGRGALWLTKPEAEIAAEELPHLLREAIRRFENEPPF